MVQQHVDVAVAVGFALEPVGVVGVQSEIGVVVLDRGHQRLLANDDLFLVHAEVVVFGKEGHGDVVVFLGRHDKQGNFLRLAGFSIRRFLKGEDVPDVPSHVRGLGHQVEGNGNFDSVVTQAFAHAAGHQHEGQIVRGGQGGRLIPLHLVHPPGEIRHGRRVGRLPFKRIIAPGGLLQQHAGVGRVGGEAPRIFGVHFGHLGQESPFGIVVGSGSVPLGEQRGLPRVQQNRHGRQRFRRGHHPGFQVGFEGAQARIGQAVNALDQLRECHRGDGRRRGRRRRRSAAKVQQTQHGVPEFLQRGGHFGRNGEVGQHQQAAQGEGRHGHGDADEAQPIRRRTQGAVGRPGSGGRKKRQGPDQQRGQKGPGGPAAGGGGGLISGVLGGAGRRRQAQLDDLEGLGVPRRFMPPGSESAFVEQRDDALGNGAQGGRGGPRIRQQKAIALRLGQQIDGDRVHPVQQILKASVRQNPLGVDGERGIVVQTASQMVTGHSKHFVRGGRELRFGLTQNAETGFREALDTVRPGHRQGPPKESRENVRLEIPEGRAVEFTGGEELPLPGQGGERFHLPNRKVVGQSQHFVGRQDAMGFDVGARSKQMIAERRPDRFDDRRDGPGFGAPRGRGLGRLGQLLFHQLHDLQALPGVEAAAGEGTVVKQIRHPIDDLPQRRAVKLAPGGADKGPIAGGRGHGVNLFRR